MPPEHERPYAQTLSALRKADLMQLSVEFRLSVDGSVVTLRNRLRTYLNSHKATLHKNPRFKALYPKQRRPAQTPSSSPRNSRSTPSITSRSHSPSPTPSDDSWNGIEDGTQHLPTRSRPHSPHPRFLPAVHHRSPSIPPAPTPEPVSLAPTAQAADHRMYPLPFFFLSRRICVPLPIPIHTRDFSLYLGLSPPPIIKSPIVGVLGLSPPPTIL
jgi:hypothetical protein